MDMRAKLSYRVLERADLSNVMECRDSVVRSLQDKSLFVEPTDSYLNKIVSGNGIPIGAFNQDRMVGFLSLVRPLEKYNLGTMLNYHSDRLEGIWHLEHVAIREEYRGFHIGERLFYEAQKKLPSSRFEILESVSPLNRASLRLSTRIGFQIVAFRYLYFGLPRYILHYPPENITEYTDILVKASDPETLSSWLEKGFRSYMYDANSDALKLGRVLDD